MTADATIKITDSGVKAALERVRLVMPKAGQMQPLMRGFGVILKSSALLNFRGTRGPDGTPWAKSFRARTEGGQTLSLSGILKRSITYDATNTSVTVGTNMQYAAIHQFGGTIRAKSGGFLSIPVTPAAREAGSPRRMPGLHVAQTLKGQYILVNEKGVTQFLLRRQVTIPARPFLGVSQTDRVELIGMAERFFKERWGA